MKLNQSSIIFYKPKISKVKTVLIGETAVGKSSIINRFTKNKFIQDFEPTLTGLCVNKEIKYIQLNKIIRFEIWDTAGQEVYRSLTKLYYKDASIVIFVYDITRKDTFEEIRDYWFNEVSNNCPKDAVFAIVGNKDDNYEFEDVDKDSVIEFSNKINALFKKTSAKIGTGIEDLFFDIGLKYLGFENKNILSQTYLFKSIDDFYDKNINNKNVQDTNKEKNSKFTLNNNNHDDNINSSNCCK